MADAGKADRLEVRGPGGLEEEWRDLPADRILTLKETTGTKALLKKADDTRSPGAAGR